MRVSSVYHNDPKSKNTSENIPKNGEPQEQNKDDKLPAESEVTEEEPQDRKTEKKKKPKKEKEHTDSQVLQVRVIPKRMTASITNSYL